MKNRPFLLLLVTLVLCSYGVQAQLTPFSLPPKWYFGHRAGMDFTGGGAPAAMAGNVWDGLGGGPDPAYDNQEGATTECFPNGNVAYYSNSCRVKDVGHVLRGPSPLLGGGNSSTQGVITIPNPASPTNQYFAITAAVDGSGGSNCSQTSYGIYVYPVDASVTPIVIGAPTQLLAGQASSSGPTNESITVSSDMSGGYWVVGVNYIPGTGTIRFVSWHISNAGVINTTPVYSPNLVAGAWTFQPQGTINISKCQTRIGYTQHGTSGTGSDYWVYNWNPLTGVATTLVRTGLTGNTFNYGCEFSPDGNVLYTTGLNGGDGLKQIVLATGTVNTLAASDLAPGSIQGWGNLKLGPDNKIYISHSYSAFEAGPKYLGVINTPNATTVGGAGYVATGYNLGAGQYPSTQRGLITLGWHNPTLPIAAASSPCTRFSYTFNQYYGTAIPVLAGSEEWDFGSGYVSGLGATPTHVFPVNGTYNIKLKVKDQYCQNFYENTRSITVSCVLPVQLIDFTAKVKTEGVVLNWQTATEINNDHFDIQRSVDGVNFETITKVLGAGNSSSLHSYEYIDNSLTSAKIVYYRLVQYDYDGQNETSHIATAYLDKVYSLPVQEMPNPFSNTFMLTKLKAEAASISIYDMLGRLLEQSETLDSEMRLEMGASLMNGSYIVQYVTGNEAYTLRIEKK